MASLPAANLSEIDDESDVIAFTVDTKHVYCLSCALERYDATPCTPCSSGIAPVHAPGPHPPGGITCYLCNEQILEPIWRDPGFYTVEFSNSDDDPTEIIAIVRGEYAYDWAQYHGSLAGGTWERADGSDFLYDMFGWEPGFIERLQNDGFKLDLSEYSEPAQDDLDDAAHAVTCDECRYDVNRAREHLKSLRSATR